MKVTVTRKTHFNAAHRLHVAEWSDEKNKDFFGLCNNPSYHGHNYLIDVSIKGEVDPITGYVIDLKILNQIIESEVIEKFDHKNLNLDTEEFKNLNPTAENIAIVIWQKIRKHFNDNYELSVKVSETDRNFAEYNGK